MVDMVKTQIETEHFSQLVSLPTRFWPNQSSSLIDHIWVNCPNKLLAVKIINRSASDHNLIYMKIRIKGDENAPGEILARNCKDFDENIFKMRVGSIEWTSLYEQTDVNLAYNVFLCKFTNILNSMAPIKKTQCRRKITPWVTDTTNKMMEERNSAREVAAASNRWEDWNSYRELRNKCTSNVRSDRTNHYKNIYESMEKKKYTKGIYKQLKRQMGQRESGPPTALRVENQIIRKPEMIANAQNDFY